MFSQGESKTAATWGGYGIWQQAVEQEAERSHERGRGTMNVAQAERVTRKSTPSDVLPLSRVQFLKVPLHPVP